MLKFVKVVDIKLSVRVIPDIHQSYFKELQHIINLLYLFIHLFKYLFSNLIIFFLFARPQLKNYPYVATIFPASFAILSLELTRILITKVIKMDFIRLIELQNNLLKSLELLTLFNKLINIAWFYIYFFS
jgi:hypothetical protein